MRPRRNNANVGAGVASFYSTNFVVDGTSNVAAKHGEPRQDYPQTVIREFKVTGNFATTSRSASPPRAATR